MSSPLKQNTTTIQELLNTVNSLPEAGGVELPTLSNEGSASDLMSGKQLIDQNGNVVTGNIANNGAITSTMDGIETKSVVIPAGYTTGGTVNLDNTIENEVNEQADLIAQITTALESKIGFNTIYIGSAAPADDFGVNGDIYIVRGGA